MTIFYETSMPYADAFFAGLGPCQGFSGGSVTPADLRDASMLLVRSTTKVDEALISQCEKLRFVATATAGFNHLDLDYLRNRNIPVYIAAGCNAVSVAEYVLSALVQSAGRLQWQWRDKTVGIVGAGQVGSALAARLEALGVRYLLCDPPKQAAGDNREFVTMDAIMQCDVITLHTPLVKNDDHPTLHLFDATRLAQLSSNQLLINASRGEVVDNRALLEAFESGRKLNVILDVWEQEPDIDTRLIPHVIFASAHIAGHSIEGKARGTEMVYQAACEQLAMKANLSLAEFLPPAQPECFTLQDPQSADIDRLICAVYDISQDDLRFRQQMRNASDFSALRKHYPIRRECSAYRLNAGKNSVSQALYGLGFQPV